MKKMTHFILLVMITATLFACGNEDETVYPDLELHKAKQELASYMSKEGILNEYLIEGIIETNQTKDGRPAFIFNRTNMYGETVQVIVSINRNDYQDYTSSMYE